MKDEEGFYYPHNLDFRGRAYPMHPHLNHLGSDLCRGILEFAEGRPLGKSGLRWLKIHLANVYAGGVDKLSHAGRIAFTENHLDDIFDSADRPLEGKRWWLGAEKLLSGDHYFTYASPSGTYSLRGYYFKSFGQNKVYA